MAPTRLPSTANTHLLSQSKVGWDLGYLTISRRRDGGEIEHLPSKASIIPPVIRRGGIGWGIDTPAEHGNYSPPATQQGGTGSRLLHDLTPPRWR